MKRALFSLATGSVFVVALYEMATVFCKGMGIWQFPVCLLYPGFIAMLFYDVPIDMSSGNSISRPLDTVILLGVNIVLYSLTAYAVLWLVSRMRRRSTDSRGQ
jgi:hypothetical protein